ncbi:MAG: hypothetical protein HYU66_20370 [Armatimonadetes bacterium]|nr:hypothetical protein [Armatimonadota bacterium]
MDYPGALLNRQAGTVEMWVSPVDWLPDDGKFHVFFHAAGRGALYLYKYWTSTNLLMLTCPELNGPYTSSQMPTGWKPGEWHHIAGTWSPDGVMAYIDGKPASAQPTGGAPPTELGPTFRIGDQPWQFPRNTSSLLDDLRIYDRALSLAHIAAHFAGDHNFEAPLSAAGSRLAVDLDSRAGTAAARFDTGGADVADEQLACRFGLTGKGATLAADAAAVRPAAGLATATLPLPSQQPGEYELVAAVTLDGQPAFELRKPVLIPTTEWLGNKLGQDDRVLPPWTPLQVQGDTVSCWGRTYRFGGSGLPVSVTSGGEELLARPIDLQLLAGGDVAGAEPGQLEVVSAGDTRVVLTGSSMALLGGARRRFDTRLTLEYDGSMGVELTCEQPETLAADALSVEIPLREGRALYRHLWCPTWMPTSGFVPKGEGVVENLPFLPFAWLGDNDRGLFWCCESDEMWPNRADPNALQIVHTAGETMLRLNPLKTGQKLPADWKLVFALQATPVKPVPRDWRKWRLTGNGPVPNATVQIVWPTAGKQDSLSAFGYPGAADPPTFQRHIDELHAHGLRAVPYLCLTWLTDSVPEWTWFRREWDMGAVDPSIPEAGWPHGFHMTSPVGRGYADFLMAKTRAFLEQYRIDGAYHDQTSPYSAALPEVGVGYVRDGATHPVCPIFGYRELYRRDYAVIKSLPRETFSMAHMSGKVMVPVLAYDDSYLDGEHFRGVVKDSYLDVLTLDAFRAEYMGRQWGLMPFFIPEFDAEHAAQVEPTRGMMGLLMLHDVSPWPIWCNVAECNRAFEALDAFGYVEAEFIPYFDARPPAATALPDVHASAYRRADGAALLIVANLGKEDRDGPVRVDLARLGLTEATAEDWPGKQPLAMDGGKLSLAVPRLGWRMVRMAAR